MRNDIRWFEINNGAVFQAKDGKWAMRSDVNSALEKEKNRLKNDKMTRALLNEANELSKNHPSKDCRFFADKVYAYLKRNILTT